MRIQNIQILRFVAAGLVLLHHAVPNNIDPVDGVGSKALVELARYGFAGVDVFFVISGFIMAETTRAMHGQGSARAATMFVLRRFWRIYSGYWPAFLFALLLSIRFGVFQGPGIHPLTSFFLLPQPFYLLGVSWSLSYELYFYVLLGVALLMPRRWALLCLLIVYFALVCHVFSNWQGGHYRTIDDYGRQEFLLQVFLTSPLVLEFLAGFFLSEFLARRPHQSLWPWLIGALIATAASVTFHNYGNLPGIGMEAFPNYPERVFFFGSAALCLVAVAVLAPPWQSSIGQSLQRLGDASYALYLLHIPLLVIFYGILFPRLGVLHVAGGLLALLLYALGCIAASWLYFRWIEQPLNRIGRQHLLNYKSIKH